MQCSQAALFDPGRANPPCGPVSQTFLTLGELEALTGAGLTVLLALHHTGVASKEAVLAQGLAEFFVGDDQRAGQSVAQSAGLAGDAAALDGAPDVEFTFDAQVGQGA
jgi:hypothetical protein